MLFQEYARTCGVDIDEVGLNVCVGGDGQTEHSILLQDLHIVGAQWDPETKRITNLEQESATINRYNIIHNLNSFYL